MVDVNEIKNSFRVFVKSISLYFSNIFRQNLVGQHGLGHWPSSPSLAPGSRSYYFVLLRILVLAYKSPTLNTPKKPNE